MASHKIHTITVANLKGGVGKTTTAVCAASGLALRGRKTVLVDLDWQHSATVHLLPPSQLDEVGTIFDVLDGDSGLLEAATPTHVEGLAVVSPGEDRMRYERYAQGAGGGGLVLRNALEGMKGEPLDYIVIDTPPSMDPLTTAAIAASDRILVPVTCEYLPLLGLKKFNLMLAGIRERLKVRAGVLGYLLTMVDRRERITWEVEEILRRAFGSLLFNTQIRVDTKLKSCPSHRRTIFEFEPEGGRARSDYESLVEEIIERVESRYDI